MNERYLWFGGLVLMMIAYPVHAQELELNTDPTISVLSQSNIDNYFTWTITKVDNTTYNASFIVDEGLWGNVSNCLSFNGAKQSNCFTNDVYDIYFPGLSQEQIIRDLKNFSGYPVKKQGNTQEYGTTHIDTTTGSGWFLFTIMQDSIEHWGFGTTTIQINNVQNYTSTLKNVFCDGYPLCHVMVNQTDRMNLYLPFDVNLTSANITYDYTRRGNNGTAYNGTYYTNNGEIGGGMYFNGSSYMLLGNGTSISRLGTNFTISFWMNITSNTTTNQQIIGYANTTHYWAVRVATSGALAVGLPSGSVYQICGVLRQNEWHHYIYTKNGTGTGYAGQQMYFDGINVMGCSNSSGTIPSFSQPMIVGARNGSTAGQGWNFKGTLDEIMIFNRSVNAAEALALYNGTYQRYNGTVASQEFTNINISQDGTVNAVNVTVNTTQYNNSNLSLIIMEFNSASVNTVNSSIFYIKPGDNTLINYSGMNTATKNISLFFNYTIDPNAYYSPTLQNIINVESFTIGGGGGGGSQCSISTVASTDYWNNACDINTTITSTGSNKFIANGTGRPIINSSIRNYNIINFQNGFVAPKGIPT